MSSRPSVQVPRVRKRPLQKQQQQKRKRQRLGGNLPRRRIDPGKSRNFLGNLMDMDILGKEKKVTQYSRFFQYMNFLVYILVLAERHEMSCFHFLH